MRRVARFLGWCLVATSTGCATVAADPSGFARHLAVLTPVDGVPVRSRDALPPLPEEEGLDAAREQALADLRGDLAEDLAGLGFDVVTIDSPAATGPRPEPPEVAAWGRDAGADYVLSTQLLAYGDIRKSWLWMLAAQAFAAGVGHGVVVTAATGDPTLGWLAGAGEFLLESAVWVGGAWVGSRGIDPVLARFWLVRAADGEVVGHWTREGTRPWRQWFRRKGQPPRAERLRAVADRIFEKLGPKLAKRAARAGPTIPHALAESTGG